MDIINVFTVIKALAKVYIGPTLCTLFKINWATQARGWVRTSDTSTLPLDEYARLRGGGGEVGGGGRRERGGGGCNQSSIKCYV